MCYKIFTWLKIKNIIQLREIMFFLLSLIRAQFIVIFKLTIYKIRAAEYKFTMFSMCKIECMLHSECVTYF